MGNSMDKILPGLYVGNIRGASSKKLLDANAITHVLAIFDKAQPVHEDRVYLCIKANDVAGQNLTQFFSQCNDFIHNARINKGTVLVHCVAGMSRSVTITTAYIMTITGLGWREALNAVRGGRRSANPNFGFQRQLLAFYHDHLHEEKKRLQSVFPPSPFDDQAECERLIEVHRQWVLHGDEGTDDSETTYPLQHNAYKTDKQTDIETDKQADVKADKPTDATTDTKAQSTSKTDRQEALKENTSTESADQGSERDSDKMESSTTAQKGCHVSDQSSSVTIGSEVGNPMTALESNVQAKSDACDQSPEGRATNSTNTSTKKSFTEPINTPAEEQPGRKRCAGTVITDEPVSKLDCATNSNESKQNDNSDRYAYENSSFKPTLEQSRQESTDGFISSGNDQNIQITGVLIYPKCSIKIKPECSSSPSNDTLNQCETKVPYKKEFVSENTQKELCVSSSAAQNEDRSAASSDVDHLIESIFTENTRPKERNVCFNENIQISKVEKIDSRMKENATVEKGTTATQIKCENIEKGENVPHSEKDCNALVDDLFKSS